MLLGIMKPQLIAIKRTLQNVITGYVLDGVDQTESFNVVQVRFAL
jgi:hypothetical protein